MADEEHYGASRAVNELAAIFDAQWANGMLPHIRFMPDQAGYRPDAADWGVTPEIAGQARIATSGLTQPPIIGLCALAVFRSLPDPSHYLADFLAMADGLERFHHFLLTERDPTGDGLVSCYHSWETGTDNSPAFEPLLARTRAYMTEQGVAIDGFGRIDNQRVRPEHRPTDKDYMAFFGLMALFKQERYDQARIAQVTPFLLQDVFFNSLLAGSLAALADLEDELAGLLEASPSATGQPSEPDRWRGLAVQNRQVCGRVIEAMRLHLWSEEDGLFYGRDTRRGEQLRVPTVSSLLPLLGDIATAAQAARLIDHLRDPAMFATPFPVPSTAVNHPAFDPRRYWAGPSWPVPNWLLVQALARRWPELSQELRRRTLAMIVESDQDPARLAGRAAQLMETNSVDRRTTTPSRRLYQHAWLWDSAIAAVGWTHVGTRPAILAPDDGGPQFWEYYHPFTGAPLGAPLMTWTAAVFLDLLHE